MNIRQICSMLLYHIESVLEENKFLEYAFGISCPEMLATFDKGIINIVAYKKILHCLEAVKRQINGNKELQDEYLGRIEILKLKLENKLNEELLGNKNWLQKFKKNVHSNLKSEKVIDRNFENNSIRFSTKNNSEEFAPTSKNNIKQETIDYDWLDIKVINDQFKDELVRLAEEMKYSAFRFQELLRKEKKVSFSFFFILKK
ncbi:uncharacterized protein ELE39_001750 [Cryptosporidium sp. chipmunk genotype I]|uniref:uncharacterized protein n=1 Tax=Cryptosporidium sp. chipmunk genotype I TaxID=1280935 RepID=UPI00351A2587|nr:hypothetical protein ELE39_001750 [Cryptosporidium sp. chipmunk genotype I]